MQRRGFVSKNIILNCSPVSKERSVPLGKGKVCKGNCHKVIDEGVAQCKADYELYEESEIPVKQYVCSLPEGHKGPHCYCSPEQHDLQVWGI